MSVQVGIADFHGRNVTGQDVAFLLLGLERRGPDYAAVQSLGSHGMGYRGFFVGPTERENQPLLGGDGIALTFDGRMDNSDELSHDFRLSKSSASDAEILMEAYQNIGEKAFELIKGEFAFVLIDRRRRCMFFARSACGSRPLSYVLDNDRLMWSSEIDDLVLKSEINPHVNDAYAVGYLYYQPDICDSPYTNVSIVPCGSYIRVSDTGEIHSAQPLWRPELISTLELKSDAEYEEAFREQLSRALIQRLRCRGPIFCELSGGLDSSTIVLLADKLLSTSGHSNLTLTTVSETYQQSRSCDESFFIGLVESALGKVGVHIGESEQHITLGLGNISFTGLPNVLHCFPDRFTTVEQRMSNVGARVLLTGNGGDELFWSDHSGSPELADLLIEGQLVAVLKKGREWSQAAGMPFWRMLLLNAIGPITVASRYLRWFPSDIHRRLRWITPQARRWFSGAGRIQGLPVNPDVQPPSRMMRLHTMRAAAATIAAGYFHEYHGIYFSHPYLHQGLTEFMLSLPMNQLSRPGQERSVMRRAMTGLLPEKIQNRKSKGTIDEAFGRAFAREYSMIGDPRLLEVCRRQYADPAPLSAAIREVSVGWLHQAGALLRLLSLERWLRSLDMIQSRRLQLRSSLSSFVHSEAERIPDRPDHQPSLSRP